MLKEKLVAGEIPEIVAPLKVKPAGSPKAENTIVGSPVAVIVYKKA